MFCLTRQCVWPLVISPWPATHSLCVYVCMCVCPCVHANTYICEYTHTDTHARAHALPASYNTFSVSSPLHTPSVRVDHLPQLAVHLLYLALIWAKPFLTLSMMWSFPHPSVTSVLSPARLSSAVILCVLFCFWHFSL